MKYRNQPTASEPLPYGILAEYQTAAGQYAYAVNDSSPDAPFERSHIVCYGCGGYSEPQNDDATNKFGNQHAAECHRQPLNGRPAFPRS